MSDKKILYNKAYMTSIANLYKKCCGYLEDAISETRKFENSISKNYKGQASDAVHDCSEKLIEHTTLLKYCCDTTSTYISESISSMQTQDDNLSKDIKEG